MAMSGMQPSKRYIDPKTGKITVGGRTMSRETYFKTYGDLFKSSAEKLKEAKKISSTPAAKKPATKKEARKETRASKKAAKSVKAASKPVQTKAAQAAREAAGKRAKLTPPNKRTAAQKLAITNASRAGIRLGGAGRSGGLGGGMNWSTK